MANFNVKIGGFDVAVEDLSNQLTPDEFTKEFVKEKRAIFWSDCDCYHFFMDFILCKKIINLYGVKVNISQMILQVWQY